MWYEDLAEELLEIRSAESYQFMALCMRELVQGKSLVLFELYHSEESHTPSQLAEELCLSSGRIANILKSLQASGYVTRERDADDARRVHVVLTPAGEEKAREIHADQVQICARVFQALGEEDAEELVRILQVISTLDL